VSDLLKYLLGNSEKTVSEGSSSSRSSELPTQPYSSHSKDNLPSRLSDNTSQFVVGIGNSIGRQREHNEDALFVMTTNVISDNTNLPLGLYIVADGMGGHLHGEKASQVAVQAMANHVLSNILQPILDKSNGENEGSVVEIMEEGVTSAHQAIIQQAPGGGSTLTGLLLLDDEMTIAHIGDSRAYTIGSDGKTKVLTTDHSLVKRLEDLGQITSDEAAVHPQRNVLYRALGQAETIDAELIAAPLPKSGYLLLCSDGLWGVVSENEMVNIVSSAVSPQEASQSLLAAANTAGGPDNISVIVIELPG